MKLETDLGTTIRSIPRTKTVQARIARSPTDGSGMFSALVSTFGPPPDVQGDIISVGAFDETITRASVEHPGSLWPVWWQHGYTDPSNAIGVVTSAAATPRGLVVDGKLAIDSNEKALAVYQGMLEDRVREWSISYGVLAEHRGEWQGEPVNYLDRLELLEISAVMSGANRFTRTLAVKAAPSVPAELADLKRRLASVFGGPSEPSSVEAVRARIDRVSGPPVRQIDVGAVTAFIAEQRAARKAEEAERKRRRQWEIQMHARVRGLAEHTCAENLALEAERDAERAEREEVERQRRNAEREAEAAQLEAVDEARRAAAMTNPFTYTP